MRLLGVVVLIGRSTRTSTRLDALPELSTPRILKSQLDLPHEHLLDPTLPTVFDQRSHGLNGFVLLADVRPFAFPIHSVRWEVE